MISPDLTIAERVSALVDAEIDNALAGAGVILQRTAEAMRGALCAPRKVRVNFSGGLTQECWSVTRGDGDYRVMYMPVAGYFSLCVESDFGPLDIGVHGSALGCFGSV
ncbi:hypothetical protein [Roseobacter sp. MH60115]|uniref:hypothetical protein n=1 Tax=Roseobacter sp. MH60115 TaxID=2785324 RepID=UPI0018A325D2|nr:hypothetical protein [Roseobacter sp. MH60115]